MVSKATKCGILIVLALLLVGIVFAGAASAYDYLYIEQTPLAGKGDVYYSWNLKNWDSNKEKISSVNEWDSTNKWAKYQYGDSSINLGPIKYDSGKKYGILTDDSGFGITGWVAVPATGYEIDAWYFKPNNGNYNKMDAVDHSAGFRYDHVYFKPKYKAKTYKVTLNANGGTAGSVTEKTATYDSAMPSITGTGSLPTRTGYKFNGYYDAASGGTQYYKADGTSARTWNKASATTLYAQWTLDSYTITYNKNDGDWVSGYTAPATYTYGTGATLPIASNIEKTWYTFDGWYADSGLSGEKVTSISTTDTGNKEYWAKWTPTPYTISYALDGGTVSPDNPETYNIESEAITLNNPTKDGNAFAGWTGTGLTDPTITVTIPKGSTGDREYTATWKTNLPEIKTLSENEYTYDGTAKTPTVSAFDTQGTQPVLNTDYTLSYEDNVNAGTATVTATGIGTYGGTKTKTFTITQRPLTVTDIELETSKPYDGTATVPFKDSKTGTLSNVVESEKESVGLTDGTFTVSSKDASATAYQVQELEGENVYELTGDPSVLANYELTQPDMTASTLTIQPKEVVLSWTYPTDAQLVYDGADKVITVSGTTDVPGETVDIVTTPSGDIRNVTEAGFHYTATQINKHGQAVEDTNYKLPASADSDTKHITQYQVTAADITTAPAVRTGLTYSGAAQGLITAGAVKSALAGDCRLEYAIGTGTYSADIPQETNADTYQINYRVAALTGNVIGIDETSLGSATIGKQSAVITADDKAKVYGDTDPALTATVSGAVGGETLDYTLARAPGETIQAGGYAITVTPGENPNYEVSTTNGVFTINPRDLTVTPKSGQHKMETTAEPVLLYDYAGAAGSEVPGFTGALTRETGEAAGTYKILQGTLAIVDNISTGFVATNYLLNFTENVLFTIDSPYIVSFDANGGSGTMDDQKFLPGVAQNLSRNLFAKTGSTFAGWVEHPEDTIPKYVDEETITATGNLVLYACWIAGTEPEVIVRKVPADGGRIDLETVPATGSINSVTFNNAPGSDVLLVFKAHATEQTAEQDTVTVLRTPFEINVVKNGAELTSGQNADVSFSIPVSAMTHITLSNVKLGHWTGAKWEYLPTTWKLDGDTYVFTARVSGFSPFSLVSAPEELHTVYVQTDGHGTAYASPGSGIIGTGVTLTAIPENGYEFKEWKILAGDIVVDDNAFTIGGTDILVKALFKEEGKKPQVVGTVSGTITWPATGDKPTKAVIRLLPTTQSFEITPDAGSAADPFIFSDVEPGVYNVEITYMFSDGTVRTANLLADTSQESSISDVDIQIPDEKVDTEVVLNDPVTVQREIKADGIVEEAVRQAEKKSGATSVKVSLVIQEVPEEDMAPIVAEIKREMPSVAADKIQPLDATVELTIDEAAPSPVTQTETVLELYVPFDKSGKDDIRVFRTHDGETNEMTALPAKPEKGAYTDNTCFIGEQGISIYSDCFSAFTVAFSENSAVNRGHSASTPKSSSSSVPPMVQETAHATTTPTPAAPTAMPTTKPTQKSPVPFIGLVAGLGAAALVLTRMRR